MALYLLYLMTEDKFHIEKIIKSDNGINNIIILLLHHKKKIKLKLNALKKYHKKFHKSYIFYKNPKFNSIRDV